MGTRFINNHIVLAVSGGADSMALLHSLHESAKDLRLRLTVAHLNHGIRGKAADEDAAFVLATARRLKLPCVMGKARVPARAKRRGISLEMAAREARYDFLSKTARKVGADVIAVAHTADDQVETILLKLMRGAARGGLSGMDDETMIQGCRVIRPLLGTRRVEIEAFLRSRKLAWREDDTNRDRDFLRNRVRHELLPLLERDYNPRIRDTLLRMGDVLAAEDEWMDGLASALLEARRGAAGALDVRGFAVLPLAARRRAIRLWLTGQGLPADTVTFDVVARVEKLTRSVQGSGTVVLPGELRATRHYALLSPVRAEAAGAGVSSSPVRIKVPGVTPVPTLGLVITATLGRDVVKVRGGGPGVLPACASLDKGVCAGRSLRIRACRRGDRMSPYGMTGSKTLKDILIDAKIPRDARRLIPVVECDGEIVWVPGYRVSAAWASEEGAETIRLEISPGP